MKIVQKYSYLLYWVCEINSVKALYLITDKMDALKYVMEINICR